MKKVVSYLAFSLFLSSLSLGLCAIVVKQENKKQENTKHLRVKFNPLGIILGSISISADYKVHSHISVGPNFFYQSLKLNKNTSLIKGWGVGADVNFAIGHEILTTGWVVRPTIAYSHYSTDLNMLSYENFSPDSASFGALFLYEWHWDSGVNTNLGFGARYDTSYTVNAIAFAAEWSFGFAF